MRSIDPALSARLDAEATTLCHCWHITRRDGVIVAFTDHDRPLFVAGRTHAPIVALEAAEATQELGFAVSGGEVEGAFALGGIEEADVARGLYDDARVSIYLVDWSDPSRHMLVQTGFIGEILRGETAFTAELRGLGKAFDEERGRLFLRSCAADLGDLDCGVSLTPVDAVVGSSDGRLCLTVPAIAGFPDDHFSRGRLIFTSGGNVGFSSEIKRHAAAGALVTLWQAAPAAIAPGDGVRLDAGCDKSFATCQAKFGNGVNFRGFPHMPGNDFVVGAAGRNDGPFDGGSLAR